MAELVHDENDGGFLSGPNFSILTAEMERKQINLGEMPFQFLAQNNISCLNRKI